MGAVLGRRGFIAGGSAMLASTGITIGSCAAAPMGRFRDDPFTLGVASGDPWPDSVVLWTRLITDPLSTDGSGGMPPRPIPVQWQIAHDASMTRLVANGLVEARPEDGHAVHVEVAGLNPGRIYYYRFIAGGAASTIGRTKTAPPLDTDWAQVRFATCCCQNFEQGLYTAFEHMAREELDFVIHLGDYIYERAGSTYQRSWRPRAHPGHVCVTLAQYRQRYALYKSDPHLRAAHAAFPFLCTLDDHEVVNNWAGDRVPNGTGKRRFLARRQAAFKAYWEHLPLRRSSKPRGPWMRLHRRVRFGNLISINILDTRQYRTPQPCGGYVMSHCQGAADPGAQMLGPRQERWLREGISRSNARWNVIAQQVPIAQINRGKRVGKKRYNMDKWDGYRAPRERLLKFLGRQGARNPIVLSGDIHRHIASDLRVDFGRPDTAPVATEFVTSSISSRGDRPDMDPRYAAWLQQNPHSGSFPTCADSRVSR